MYQCYSVIIDCGISAIGHVKEVVNGLNAIDKCYIYQIMYNFQLHGSEKIDSQILMLSSTQNNYASLDKEFHKHMSKDHQKHGVIDQGKKNSKRKWIDREYHVQDNADVAHKDVKMYCDNNQSP